MHVNYNFETQQNLQNSLENPILANSENKPLFTHNDKDHANDNEYDDCHILSTSSEKT